MTKSYTSLLKKFGFRKINKFGEEMWTNNSASMSHTLQFENNKIFAEKRLLNGDVVIFSGYENLPLSRETLVKLFQEWFPE